MASETSSSVGNCLPLFLGGVVGGEAKRGQALNLGWNGPLVPPGEVFLLGSLGLREEKEEKEEEEKEQSSLKALRVGS